MSAREPSPSASWLRPLLFHGLMAALVGGTFAGLAIVREAAWLLWLTAAGLAAYAAAVLPRALRRRRLLTSPFPASHRLILQRYVRFYRGLDEAGRARFERHMSLALADYRFEPVGGARVDDEIRVLSAAAAATLAHGARLWPFRGSRTILVYPDHFDRDYQVSADHSVAGMVHAQGPVVLSEKALLEGYRRETDGYNVALHELAHELDMDDGFADGVPAGLGGRAYGPWVALMRDRMERARAHRSVLRPYAGTHEAETFAVAVELFFEDPQRLYLHDRALFEALESYFGLDPRPIVRAGGPPKQDGGG